MHSNMFGYGKVDVNRTIAVARNHTMLGPLVEQSYPILQTMQNFTSNQILNATYQVPDRQLSVERLAVTVWVTYPRRGDLSFSITSPQGVVSVLSRTRRLDASADGLMGWTFHSVRHWGEQAQGVWTLSIKAISSSTQMGTLLQWKMDIFGEGMR
jgi:kexin